MKKQHFIYILFLYVIAVFYLSTTTPISPHEAKMFYASSELVSTLMHWSSNVIEGFLGLRIFFVFFGFFSIALFYKLSRTYFPRIEDAYLSTVIFMILPGILTAITLANVSIIVLCIVLLFVLLYERSYNLLLPFLMLILFFIHDASIVFFVALLLYGIIYKDKKLAIASLAFLLAFIYLAKGIDIGGNPSGHFAEIFGLYASVFSPLVFLYFLFTIRNQIKR